jgi:hypothetical protein
MAFDDNPRVRAAFNWLESQEQSLRRFPLQWIAVSEDGIAVVGNRPAVSSEPSALLEGLDRSDNSVDNVIFYFVDGVLPVNRQTDS